MAQNLQIAPDKRDYVVVDGVPVPSDRVEEAVYYALTIQQGQWLYADPGQGSQIYRLLNSKRVASTEQQFSGYAMDAIQRQVISTGKATLQQVQNLSTSRDGTSNQINVQPSQTQLSDQLNFVGV